MKQCNRGHREGPHEQDLNGDCRMQCQPDAHEYANESNDADAEHKIIAFLERIPAHCFVRNGHLCRYSLGCPADSSPGSASIIGQSGRLRRASASSTRATGARINQSNR